MVSMIFRARLSSFLAGFAVASGFAVYQLRNDVRESHALLAEQVRVSISNSRPRSQTPTNALCVSDPYRSLLHPPLSLSLSLSLRVRQGGRGGPQYKYFGAARNLPGVKELFEKPKAQKKARRTKHEILKGIDADYFGYRDEDDGVLLKVEAEADEARSAAVREEQEEVLAAKGAVDGEGPAPGGKGKGGEGGSSAYAHLPDEKATEKSSAVAKKSDLMAKYASEELQQQVQYQ